MKRFIKHYFKNIVSFVIVFTIIIGHMFSSYLSYANAIKVIDYREYQVTYKGEDIRKPTAKFSIQTPTTTLEENAVGSILVGEKIKIIDKSTPGSGTRVDAWDFQYFTKSGSSAEYLFSKPDREMVIDYAGKWDFYLNVKDNKTFELNYGTHYNFSENGNYKVLDKRKEKTHGEHWWWYYTMISVVAEYGKVEVKHIDLDTGIEISQKENHTTLTAGKHNFSKRDLTEYDFVRSGAGYKEDSLTVNTLGAREVTLSGNNKAAYVNFYYKKKNPAPIGAWVDVKATVDPTSIEYIGNDIQVKVTVDAELKNYEHKESMDYWILFAARKEASNWTMEIINKKEFTAKHEFLMTVPKSVMTNREEFNQFFKFKASAYIKDNPYVESREGEVFTNIYKKKPAPPLPKPVAVISGRSSVMAGDIVTLSGTSSYAYDDATITNYYWQIEPSNHTIVEDNGEKIDVLFHDDIEYDVYLAVEDSKGQQSDTAYHKVVGQVPTPYAWPSYQGTLKENRKITIDATNSMGQLMYPINWTKTEWKITPISGGTTTDIKYEGSLNGVSKKDIIIKKAGKYKVELTVYNNRNISHTNEMILDIKEDITPVADFSTMVKTFRDPDNNNKAFIWAKDNSYSLDQDTISQRIWRYAFDSNNNGSFIDETWITIDSTNKEEVEFEVNSVGKYMIELEVKENFGQPTIASFIVDSDYKRGNTLSKEASTKIVDVSNLAPSTDLLASKTDKVKLIDVVINGMGSIFDLDKIKAKVNDFLAPTYEEEKVDHKITILEDERITSMPNFFVGSKNFYLKDYKGSIFEVTSDSNNYAKLTSYSTLKYLTDYYGSNYSYNIGGISTDNKAILWGYNNKGQLGSGDTIGRYDYNNAMILDIANVVQLDVSDEFSIVLDADGYVYTMGSNSSGQIGDGTTTNRLTPYRVEGLPPIKKVSISERTVLALSANGEVWGWGINSNGQIGDGTTINKLTPIKVPGLSNIIDISSGTLHSLAVNKNGEAFSWGSNADGRLGIDSTDSTNRTTPQKVSLDNVISVGATYVGSRFLTSNGDVYYAGNVSYYRYDDGEDYERREVKEYKPKLIDSNIVKISTKKYNAIHLKKTGEPTLYYYYSGGGWYSTDYRYLYTKGSIMGTNTIKDIVAYENSVFAISESNNALMGIGIEHSYENKMGTGTNTSESYTYRSGLVIKPKELIVDYRDTNIYLDNIVDVAVNNSRIAYAVDDLGRVYTWGRGSENVSLVKGISNIKKIRIFGNGSFAIDKSGNVYKFNSFAQVKDITFERINGLSNIVEVHGATHNYSGSNVYYALDENGTLHQRWLTNENSVQVLDNVSSVAYTGNTTIVSTKDGSLYSWGYNYNGMLGTGDSNTSKYVSVPTLVTTLTNVKKVFAENSNSNRFYAVTENGKAYGWGSKGNNILPGGTYEYDITSPKYLGYENVKTIIAHDRYIAALRNDGTIVGKGLDSGSLSYGYMLRLNNSNISTLTSLQLFPTQKKTSAIIDNIIWRDNAAKYYVDYNNNLSSLIGKEYSDTVTSLNEDNVNFIGINNDSNESIIRDIIEDNNYSGKYINSGDIDYAFNKIKSYTTDRKAVDLYFNLSNTAYDDISFIERKALEIIRPILEDYNIEPKITVVDGERIAENRLYYKGTDDYFYEYDPIDNKTTKISSTTIISSFVADDGYVYYNSGTENNITLYRYHPYKKTTENVFKFYESVYMGMFYDSPQYVPAKLTSNFVVQNGKVFGNRNYTYWGSNYVEYVSVDLKTKEVTVLAKSSYSTADTGTIYGYSNFVVNSAGGINYEILIVGSGANYIGGANLPRGGIQYWFSGYPAFYLSPYSGNMYHIGSYIISGLFQQTKGGSNVLNAGSANGSGVYGHKDKVYFSVGDYPYHGGVGGFYVYDELLNKQTTIKPGNGHLLLAMTPDKKLWYSSAGKIYTYDVIMNTHTDMGTLAVKQPALYHPNAQTRFMRKTGIEETLDSNNWRKNSYGFYSYINDGKVEKDDAFIAGAYIGSNPIRTTLNDLKDIQASSNHTVALKNDGTVWTWGFNYYGQLGNGNTTNSGIPLRVGITEVKQIAAGSNHTVALKNDGTVWSWGYNGNGQLGDGTTTSKSTPVKVNITDVKEIVALGSHVIALKNDGTVWSWGYNNYGQLGDGTTTNRSTPVKINITDVTRIISQNEYTVAMKNDGTVWSWGRNDYGQLGDGTTTNRSTPVKAIIDDVKELKLSQRHTVALKNDGTVWSWGYNYSGQLGNGSTANRSTPVQVNISDVKEVILKTDHTIALKTNGTVWSWGFNNYGQLGDGTTTNRSTPVQVNISDVNGIVAENYYTIALKTDGTVWSWGFNNYGQLGDGTTTNKYTPVKVFGLTEVAEVISINSSSMAIKNDGTIWSWGNNISGQLGDGTTNNRNIPVKTFVDASKMFSNGSQLLVIAKNKVNINAEGVYSWGMNGSGQLGDGTTNSKTTPSKTIIDDVKHIATRSDHTIVLKNDGTVWASGYNYYGQLGDGTTTSRSTPVQIAINDVKNVVVGASYTVALKNDGTVWSWGYNGNGQLGNGTTNNRNTPVQVNITDVKEIYVGGSITIALKNDGTVWSWGYNNYGQVGDGTTTDRTIPIKVNITDVKKIYIGDYHIGALKNDGTLWSWGYNNYGQIGDGTTTNRRTPVEVNITDVKDIKLGAFYTVALKNDGTVWSWGLNNRGQLGDGTEVTKNIPVKVNITDVKSLEVGTEHTIALKNDGTVWGWGSNVFGQLAWGITSYSRLPIQVNITDVKDIKTGLSHTVALRNNGTVYAWGRNNYGQIGNGTTTDATTLVQVNISDVKDLIVGHNHVIALKNDKVIVEEDGKVSIENELKDDTSRLRIVDKFLDKNTQFLGLGTNNTKADLEGLSAVVGGAFFDNQNLDAAFADLAQYIIENAGKANLEMDLYVLLNQEVEFHTFYEDKENDPLYKERWRITHEPHYFENDLGLFGPSGEYLIEPVKSFDKTGKYEIVYQAQDNPKEDSHFDDYKMWSKDSATKINLYVHRKPIADFSVDFALNATEDRVIVTLQNQSYDFDHMAKADKGIVEESWEWKAIDEKEWKEGKIPTELPLGKRYQIKLEAKDREGVWSDAKIKEINTDVNAVTPTIKATPEMTTGWYNKAKAIAEGDLKVNVKATAYFGKTITEVQYSWSKQMTTPGAWTTTTTSEFDLMQVTDGIWYLHLKAKDSGDLESETYVAGPYMIDKTPPTAPTIQNSQSWTKDTVAVTILPGTDTTSGVDRVEYRLTGGTTQEWTVYEGAFNITNPSTTNIFARTIDKAGNVSPEASSNANIDRIPPTVDADIHTYEGSGPLNVRVTASDTGGSGLKEVKYQWTKSTTKPVTGWNTTTQSTFVTSRLDEGIWYLHMESFDNVGNSFYRFRGTYDIQYLKLTATLMPNPAMAGDQLIFTVDTEGNADKIEIIVPNDIVSKDNRAQKGYPAISYPLVYAVDGAVDKKRSIFKYVLWNTTDQTLSKNNTRLRAPYKFIVRAYKGTKSVEVELFLDVKGNVLELIKPGIKLNGN